MTKTAEPAPKIASKWGTLVGVVLLIFLGLAVLFAALIYFVVSLPSEPAEPINSVTPNVSNVTLNFTNVTFTFGLVTLIYESTENPAHAEAASVIRETDLFEKLVKKVDDSFTLQERLYVVFEDCGEVNAYWSPGSRSISICYELLAYNLEDSGSWANSTQERHAFMLGEASFAFYHELGHALINVFDLPATGKEEDAVDQLATLILIGNGRGEDAIAEAKWYERSAQKSQYLAFWDEHSLDQQRFYNIVCWVYGVDPAGYYYVVGEGILPESRADRCRGEAEQIERAWSRLLEPYAKKNILSAGIEATASCEQSGTDAQRNPVYRVTVEATTSGDEFAFIGFTAPNIAGSTANLSCRDWTLDNESYFTPVCERLENQPGTGTGTLVISGIPRSEVNRLGGVITVEALSLTGFHVWTYESASTKCV